jgi:type VII secretion protein EccB
LASASATADALGYGAATSLPVSAAFLNALPAGADLAPPAVAGAGVSGPRLDGGATRVGQVFVVQTPGSARQYYLLQKVGLEPITTTQAALALSGPGVRQKAYAGGTPAAITISADALNGALAPKGPSGGTRGTQQAGAALPATPPVLLPVDDDQNLCVRLAAVGTSGTQVSVVLVGSADLSAAEVKPTAALAQACLAVDAIVVPPDGGSLVRVLGSGGGAVGDTMYLVTDTGVKYRIPSAAAAKALGYDPANARGVPSPLLNMVPAGPDLSHDNATAGRSVASGVPVCAQESGSGPKGKK